MTASHETSTATVPGLDSLDVGRLYDASLIERLSRKDPEVRAFVMERMKAEHDSLIEQRRERTRRAGSEASHRYRQAWAEIGVRVAGIGLGFAAVINLSALAKHYSDIGQAGYGVLIVTSGAVAIAGIFVLGKFVGRMPRVPINTQSPPPVDPSANGGGPAAP